MILQVQDFGKQVSNPVKSNPKTCLQPQVTYSKYYKNVFNVFIYVLKLQYLDQTFYLYEDISVHCYKIIK